jgi:hypothetical protein
VGRLDFRSSDFVRDALRTAVEALAGTAAPLATPPQLHTSSPPSRALLAEPVQLGPVTRMEVRIRRIEQCRQRGGLHDGAAQWLAAAAAPEQVKLAPWLYWWSFDYLSF